MTTTERHLANMMLIAGQRWIETGRPEDLATLHRRINQLQHYRDLVKAQCAGKNRDPRYVQDVSHNKTHGKQLQSRQSSKRTLEYRSYKKPLCNRQQEASCRRSHKSSTESTPQIRQVCG